MSSEAALSDAVEAVSDDQDTTEAVLDDEDAAKVQVLQLMEKICVPERGKKMIVLQKETTEHRELRTSPLEESRGHRPVSSRPSHPAL